TIAELQDHLRQGHAVQVSLDDPYDKGNHYPINVKDHYVIVTGFEMYMGKEYVRLRDPNGADNGNAKKWPTSLPGRADYSMPLDIFLTKWGPNTDDGYNNFMVVYARPGTVLAPTRLDGLEHSIAIADGYWNLVNDADRLVHPDSVGSWLHGAAGTV